MPSFYEYYWAPYQKGTITRVVGKQKVLNGYGIPHHAIHILCLKKYKHGFAGFPQSLALIEAMCSSLDVYFEMYKVNLGNLYPTHPNLNPLKQNYLRLKPRGSGFRKFLLKSSLNPFETYRLTVKSMFQLMIHMHKYHQKFQDEDPGALKTVERMLNSPYAKFHYQYDYAMFVFYLLGIGGRSSSRKDQATVKAIVDLLDSSENMKDFIECLLKK